MGLLTLVSFVAGMGFLAMGAWPVFCFFGLDVLLVYVAFRLNYRAARAFEVVDLDRGSLTLTQVDCRGRYRSFEFNPRWVKLQLTQAVDGRTALSLASHGRRLPFGAFLNDDEKVEFAQELDAKLAMCRR